MGGARRALARETAPSLNKQDDGILTLLYEHLLPARAQNNKRVFHQQMLETGNSLLFDGEYGGAAPAPYYPSVGGGAYGGGASASYGYAAVPRGGGGYEQPSYY